MDRRLKSISTHGGQEGGRINLIEDDAEVDSREMKHPAQVARLAPAHAGAAVCIRRGQPAVCGHGIGKGRHPAERLFRGLIPPHPLLRGGGHVRGTKVLLSLLPDTFDTKSHRYWQEQQNVSERTVMNYLKELCRAGC